jgi:hypothetical protein
MLYPEDFRVEQVPSVNSAIVRVYATSLKLRPETGFPVEEYCLLRSCSCKNDVSEERIASIIRATKIRELGTKLAVTSNRSVSSQRASVLTRATRHSVPEDGILHHSS